MKKAKKENKNHKNNQKNKKYILLLKPYLKQKTVRKY